MAGDVVARVPSSRDPAVVYQVRLEDGVYRCECPGFWRWHKCRHVTALEALKALPLAPARAAPPVADVAPAWQRDL